MTVAGANFPMALDQERRRVLVMFRSPAKLGVFAKRCDDLFVVMIFDSPV